MNEVQVGSELGRCWVAGSWLLVLEEFQNQKDPRMITISDKPHEKRHKEAHSKLTNYRYKLTQTDTIHSFIHSFFGGVYDVSKRGRQSVKIEVILDPHPPHLFIHRPSESPIP